MLVEDDVAVAFRRAAEDPKTDVVVLVKNAVERRRAGKYILLYRQSKNAAFSPRAPNAGI